MTPKRIMRMATPSDAGMISHIYLAFRKECLSFAPLIHSDADIYQWIHEVLIPNFQVWVVEQDNVMIGMMAITEKQGINWIEQLYLLPGICFIILYWLLTQG